jgi:hypothetical protein
MAAPGQFVLLVQRSCSAVHQAFCWPCEISLQPLLDRLKLAHVEHVVAVQAFDRVSVRSWWSSRLVAPLANRKPVHKGVDIISYIVCPFLTYEVAVGWRNNNDFNFDAKGR